MNRHDVIKHMGRFPDAINPPKRLTAKTWECSTCGIAVTPSRVAVVYAWNRRPGRATEERLKEMEEMK